MHVNKNALLNAKHCSFLLRQVYLGRADQASDPEVISSQFFFTEDINLTSSWFSFSLKTSIWHQADCQKVIHGLGITHVLSTSRIRASKFRGLVYILVNKVKLRIQNEQERYKRLEMSRCLNIFSQGLLLLLHAQVDHQLCPGGAGGGRKVFSSMNQLVSE